MTRSMFLTVMGLAVMVALLTLMETWMYKRWLAASYEQRDVQTKLLMAQRQKTFCDQFLRRLALESQRDPALLDLLKKHRLKVTVANPASDQGYELDHTAAPPAAVNATTAPGAPTPAKSAPRAILNPATTSPGP